MNVRDATTTCPNTEQNYEIYTLFSTARGTTKLKIPTEKSVDYLIKSLVLPVTQRETHTTAIFSAISLILGVIGGFVSYSLWSCADQNEQKSDRSLPVFVILSFAALTIGISLAVSAARASSFVEVRAANVIKRDLEAEVNLV